jgi:hypothetical protein
MRVFSSAVAAWCFVASQAFAATISFEATNLGTNQYRYDYTVTDLTVAAFHDISIEFDASLYSALTNPAAPSADWDILLLQPDVPSGATGFFDALALVDGASLNGVFSVEFTYLGGGTPGPQPFSILLFADDGETLLDVVQTGVTKSRTPVPEPTVSVLALIAVGGLHLRRRHKTLGT